MQALLLFIRDAVVVIIGIGEVRDAIAVGVESVKESFSRVAERISNRDVDFGQLHCALSRERNIDMSKSGCDLGIGEGVMPLGDAVIVGIEIEPITGCGIGRKPNINEGTGRGQQLHRYRRARRAGVDMDRAGDRASDVAGDIGCDGIEGGLPLGQGT